MKVQNVPAGAVGIFDSGVGGLTVCQAIRRRYPTIPFVYLGDSLRAPFGDRSLVEIRQINFEILDFLNQFPLRMIVSGCNTSSATVLQDNQAFFSLPVLGLIDPAAKAVGRLDQVKKITVLATAGTVRSGAYGQLIRQYAPEGVHIRELACPAFVPLIENPNTTPTQFRIAVREFQSELEHSDVVVFGCTHYPYLQHYIRELCPPWVNFVDPAEAVAEELGRILGSDGDTVLLEKAPGDQFFTTGNPQTFKTLAGQLVPGLVTEVKRVHLTTLELFGLSPLKKAA